MVDMLSKVLAVGSGVAYTAAFIDYNRKMLKGQTSPSAMTWLIWSIVCLVGTPSYLKSTGDYWKSIIPLLNIALCVGTTVVLFWLRKFKRPDKWDYVALALGVIAVFVWIHYGSAKYANLIVQLAIIAGFVPTWRAIRIDPTCEQPRAWWIWTIGYFLAFLVVILRWNNQAIDVVYPINTTVLHMSVPILIQRVMLDNAIKNNKLR